MCMIKNLWFVDDDIDDCELFETVRKKVLPSSSITYLHNGQVFMDFLTIKRQPDLIILDVNMPCKNGLDCLCEIRSDSAYSKLPIVIFSSSAEPNHILEAYEKGANLYFTKPSNYNEVLKGMDFILNMNWNDPFQITKNYHLKKEFVPFKGF